MIVNFLGSSFILLGFIWFIFVYKKTKKVDTNFIFYSNAEYKEVNEEKILRLQKIKYMVNGVCYISIGIVWLLWGMEFCVLGCLPILTSLTFSVMGKKYVKV